MYEALVALLDRGIHHDDRNLGRLSLLQDRHHRLAVHGAENDGVDLFSDEVLHLIDLDGDAGFLAGGDQEKLVAGLLDRILNGCGDGFLEVVVGDCLHTEGDCTGRLGEGCGREER